MKTELKVKFLQHLTQKKKDQGFTLIELLVVIIIIGILSAIALPSFLNQASKARQSEAKNNIGALNRAQQSYYLENQEFSGNITALGVGIPAESDNYSYSAAAKSGTLLTANVINKAKAKNADLKGYAGGVFKDATTGNTAAILCEQKTAGIGDPADPDSATACPTATQIKVK